MAAQGATGPPPLLRAHSFSFSHNAHLRSSLLDIERQTTDLEVQLAHLLLEKKKILEQLNSIIYPVLSLPTELTCGIFQRCAGSPLVLAGVCSAWRAVAISTPALWKHFKHARSSRDTLYSRLVSWLPRAGNLPLSVDIDLFNAASPDAILALLATYTSQWKSLAITSPRSIPFFVDAPRAPFSHLETLGLDIHLRHGEMPPCMTAFEAAPRLRDVSLSGVSLLHVTLPWTRLTTLTVTRQSVAQCVLILAQTPNLETLSTRALSDDPAPTPPAPPLVLPHLHTLKMHFKLTLLDHLTLPALARLELTKLSAAGLWRLESHVMRTSLQARTLILHDTEYPWAHDCISLLPALTDLALDAAAWPPADVNSLLAELGAPCELLPALASLRIEGCRNDVDFRALAAMSAARRQAPEGAPRLVSLRIAFADESDPATPAVRAAMLRLVQLRARGLALELHSPPGWAAQMMNELEHPIPR
ncbi:hypothetical protein B0H15DRAFT_861014 [Mycena belliarum]|uniref:F-box domain-containing protein n=1 Tax=Mycena belliarum TaxID=1033014 RepID=A0AAD6TXS2_9AGAR|nr:hypothetical protein B0H15DRAFT_861014 [Mycena belliae]